MARANRTKQVALGFLTVGPMSGYDLKQAIEESVSNFWSESYGQIYPTLQALVEEGLATRARTEVRGDRQRHVYAITAKGRTALRRWLLEPITPMPPRNELLLKLFFGRHLGAEAAKNHVKAFKQHLLERSQRYEAIDDMLTREAGDQPDLAYWRLTVEYGRLRVDAHLAWCDRALAVLKKIDRAAKRSGRHGSPKRAVTEPG